MPAQKMPMENTDWAAEPIRGFRPSARSVTVEMLPPFRASAWPTTMMLVVTQSIAMALTMEASVLSTSASFTSTPGFSSFSLAWVSEWR